MADDGVAQRFGAVVGAGAQGGFQNGQFGLRVRRIGCPHHAQRARVVQQAQQQLLARGLVQRAVVGLQLGGGQQFLQHGFMLV